MLNDLLNRRRTTPDERRKKELLEEYTLLTDKLEQIRANYDFVSEDAEIDALIYEENAVLCRLSALYRRARESGIHVDYPERRG
ncbi:MAG: DUF2508 family protein [Oscillospiraceae bacterium]|nr:DUF2508 family protein [Oscillospiraceae bacterium]